MIIELSLNQKYQPEITGLGDIYEQISVEAKRKALAQKFKKGMLFLVSNKEHGERGLTLYDLEEKMSKEGYQILEKGFVDSPPWPSRPRPAGSKSPLLKFPLMVFLSQLIFRFLIIFEFLWEGRRNSHMVYVFGQKGGESG